MYPGARYEAFEMWKKEAADQYFEIIKLYKDQVIMEYSGHDHFSSLRVHDG